MRSRFWKRLKSFEEIRSNTQWQKGEYWKIFVIHLWSRWIMLFKAIVNYSLCLNTAQVVSFSSIFRKLADSRKMPQGSMHRTFCWLFTICTPRIFFTEIWNQKTYSLRLMAMWKWLTLVFQKKTSWDTTRQKVFVEQLNTLPQKFFKETVMAKPVIGGALEE